MRLLPALLVAGLAACAGAPEPPPPARPIASAQAPNATNNAAAAQNKGVTVYSPNAANLKVNQAVNFNGGKNLETVDVYVDLHDANGMRNVLPYLYRMDEWMLIKCEHTSPTTKHYRFQRVATSGEALPMPDPLKPRPNTPPK